MFKGTVNRHYWIVRGHFSTMRMTKSVEVSEEIFAPVAGDLLPIFWAVILVLDDVLVSPFLVKRLKISNTWYCSFTMAATVMP